MKKTIIFILLSIYGQLVFADISPEVRQLQDEWAQIKYKTPAKEQEQKYKNLIGEAEQLVAKNPKDADALIWEGIIRSTYAGVEGGLGALGDVKKAKKLFEKSIKLDPDALDGSAYTSLGSLYYLVPGWPLGFGDNKKAEEMLKMGLQHNPDGIDPNYFYGDYLKTIKNYTEALAALQKALQAPGRPGREVADEGRRTEIQADITEIKKLVDKKGT